MLTVCAREFISLFKSTKSILFILFMVGSSYGIAYLAKNFLNGFFLKGGTTGLSSLLFIIVIFGFLFVFSISHDMFSREIYSRTARFLVTKTKRDNIVYGKFLGVFFFWIACISITCVALITITRAFSIVDFLQALLFMIYPITLCMLVSVLFSRPGYSIFIGLLVSLAIPILGVWSSVTANNIFLIWIRYLTPYYYVYEGGYKQFFIIILSVIFLLLTIIIFRKKDL